MGALGDFLRFGLRLVFGAPLAAVFRTQGAGPRRRARAVVETVLHRAGERPGIFHAMNLQYPANTHKAKAIFSFGVEGGAQGTTQMLLLRAEGGKGH